MKQTWKPGTLEAPLPAVLVTCGKAEQANILTIAWTGILNSDPPKTYISVRPTRHSYPILKREGEFIINLVTEGLVRAADTCGVVSGAKEDKFALCRLDREKASSVSCPGILQSPLQLECRVTDTLLLGSHEMFIADIVAVNVEESLLDASGRVRLDKAGLIAFSHGAYYALGKRLGTFGYSVRKKKAGTK